MSFNDIANDKPFTLIAGPCVIESADHALQMAFSIADICRQRDIPFIFKASYDKANRSKDSSFRGVGLEEGVEILSYLHRCGITVTTDVHDAHDVDEISDEIDLLQIPALLSRQTDLIQAAAQASAINIKKGQFMAPEDIRGAVHKAAVTAKGKPILITERGTCFGYNNIVVDFRSLAFIKQIAPTIFDATHTTQLPGLNDGRAEYIPILARAAIAVGVAGLFMEVHDNPKEALSDGPNMLELAKLPGLLDELKVLDACAKARPPDGPLRSPR